MGAVLDACAVVPLFIESPLTAEAEQAVRPYLAASAPPTVPHLFHYEVANAIWTYVRASRVSAIDAKRMFERLQDLPLATVGDGELIRRSLELACARSLAVYDCCYLELARRQDDELVTADRRLAELAEAEGIRVVIISALT